MTHFILLLVLLLITDSISYPYGYPGYGYRPGYGYGYGYRTGYYYGYNGKCFSGDSFVRLSSSQEKMINSVKSGDQLLTIAQSSEVISTDMIMMLHEDRSNKALFYTLITESGFNISLTEYHLIPIKLQNRNEKYIFAKHVQIGDFLFVLEKNNQIKSSKVIDIIIQIKIGYYAPLTTEGTLIINNILASCFASVKDHSLAQYSMFPFRYYYQLNKRFSLNDPLNLFYYSNDLHWTVRNMFAFASYFIPEIIV